MRSVVFLVVALLIGLSGCAFAPQAVVITPEVSVQGSDVGGDRSVDVNVVDERPKTTLGTRGVRGVGADLTISGDLTTTIQKAVSDGLLRHKFKPLAGQNPDGRELRVEIRALDYEVIQGFWAGTLRVGVGLKAICVRGTMRPYEQLHRGEFAESVQVVQGEAANNTYVSKAVSSAVNSLLRDDKLMNCLAS